MPKWLVWKASFCALSHKARTHPQVGNSTIKNIRADNIVQLFVHEKKFVCESGTIPFLYYIMAADDAIRLLQAHGRVLFVDGTLVPMLTTIMVLVGKVGVPVAWMLCNSQTQDYYAYFFKFISNLVLEITGHVLAPLTIFVDFEDALYNATIKAFPGAKICDESFHFMQANQH